MNRKDLFLLLARLRKDIKGYSWLTGCLIVLIRGFRVRKGSSYEMYQLLFDCHDWTSDIANLKGEGLVLVQPIFVGKPWSGSSFWTWLLWYAAGSYLRRGSPDRGILAGFLLLPIFLIDCDSNLWDGDTHIQYGFPPHSVRNHRHTQRQTSGIAQMFPNPMKLTIKINHHGDLS